MMASIRIAFALAFVVSATAATLLVAPPAASAQPEMEVYVAPTCGCCGQWVEYIENEGFAVTVHEVDRARLNAIKEDAGLDWGLASCHTAFVDGYVVEGHVPAREIRRLLDERPDVVGISVPGMPIGSPGMEMGNRRDPYDVLAFDASGNSEVFARYHQD